MADAFNRQVFAMLGVGASVVLLRTYARCSTVGFRALMLDDYLMLVALVVYGLESGAAYSVGALYHGLANNSMTPEERVTLSPDSAEYHMRVGGSQLQLMGWSSYTLLLWLLKLCMCVFYTRLTSGLAHMRLRIKIGFVIITVTYIATVGSILGGCGAPFRKNWQINPDPGNYCQPAVSKIDLLVTVVLNVLSDAYLLSIPLPLVWKAQISAKKKAVLLLLFSGAIFVMACGILRCVIILTAGANGAQEAGSWAVRESFVAVVVSNLPMIQPLFISAAKKLGSSNLSRLGTRSNGNSSRSNASTIKDFVMLSSSRKQPRTLYPLDTMGGSEEHIIEEPTGRRSEHHSRRVEEQNYRDTKQGAIHVASETVVGYESRRASSEMRNGGRGQFLCSVSANQGDR